MPLDYRWADNDVHDLLGANQAIAKLAIVLAKAPYRVTDDLASAVRAAAKDEARFVRILAWASCVASRRLANVIAERVTQRGPASLHSVAA